MLKAFNARLVVVVALEKDMKFEYTGAVIVLALNPRIPSRVSPVTVVNDALLIE